MGMLLGCEKGLTQQHLAAQGTEVLTFALELSCPSFVLDMDLAFWLHRPPPCPAFCRHQGF